MNNVPAADSQRSERALDGLTVLEVGTRIGTSVSGSVLAQLGATVIFVEPRETVDESKGRFRDQFAAGKLSLAPDLSREEDRRLLCDLVRGCDLILTSSDVDTAAHRSLGWHDLAKDAIVCDVTAFGSTGPFKEAALGDVEIQALSGVLDSTGLADRPPTPIGLPLIETLAGIYAAGAALCATRQRRTQGFSQWVEVSLYDVAFSAMTSFLAPALSGMADDGITRVGNRHTMAAPWNVYRASDGWILLCAGSDDQWQRMCALMEQQSLGVSAAYAKNVDRVAKAPEVDAIVQAWVERRGMEECVQRFGELGIPCGPIVAIDGFPREANLEHRKMVFDAFDPLTNRTIKVPGSPFKLSRSPGAALVRIPSPDEDRARISSLARTQRTTPIRAVGATPDRPPLHGVRVVEIGHYTTAPVATRFLASIGAEVIKVEPPGGEAVRHWPPAKNGQGVFFTFQNADKKSLTLDLESEADLAVLEQLIASADVLVENLRPGALAKRGLSPEEVRRLNPRLVYCSISGFGADSLYPGRPAFDTVIQAMSGLMDVSHVDGMPLKTGPSLADVMGAASGFVAIIAALEFRDRTNGGQYLDLSMQDISAWATQTLWNRQRSEPQKFVMVPCTDGYVLADRARLAEVIPDASLREFGSRTRDEVVTQLKDSEVRAVPVLRIREVVTAPQTLERKLWFTVEESGATSALLATPLRLQRTPPLVRQPGPALGRDNAEILKGLGDS